MHAAIRAITEKYFVIVTWSGQSNLSSNNFQFKAYLMYTCVLYNALNGQTKGFSL